MEEAEQLLESKEDGLKNGTDPPDSAVRKASAEIKNKGDENNSFGEFKAVVGAKGSGDLKDGEDEKNLKEAKDRKERKNLGKAEDKEEKKEVEVQNGKEMKCVVEEKDDKSVKEMKNGKDEGGVEEMKDDEHCKTTSSEKDEESVLVKVEEKDGGKARKEAEDMEMVGAEDVVEKETADVKDEGKLVVREGEEENEDNGGNADKTVGDNHKAESLKRKRKRGRGQRPSETGEAKKKRGSNENVEEKELKGSGQRSKEVLSTPVVSSIERPVRERKTVERLVEVIEKGPDSTVIIEKGRGIPLIKIPNVAYNLARKKPAELKVLHQTLFGRKGKAVNFRSNLLQFSGFAWHESQEKQRAKIKEKLDKCVKETLLDFCDLFDLTVSKTNTKKDEIIVKLLDFMEAPHAMDVTHAEEQSSKSRKRERAPKVDASKSSGGNFEKRSRQKHDKTEGTPNSEVKSSHDTEDDDEEDSEEEEDEDSEEDGVPSHSESDAVEQELEGTGDEEKEESEVDTDLTKEKQIKKSQKSKEKQDVKKSPKKQVSSHTVKRKIGSNSKKTTPKTDGKSALKTPPSKHPKAKKSDDTGEKVFSRKKKDAESPKKSNSKPNSKEKSLGKASKSKSGKGQKSGPNKAELRKSICEILKEVDFNTATFTDILKQLASQYKIDLTPRKAAIKLLIQEELTKVADEAEDSQDEEEMQ